MKVEALKHNNFDQLENFIEYENFLSKSYLMAFNFNLLDKATHLTFTFANS